MDENLTISLFAVAFQIEIEIFTFNKYFPIIQMPLICI